MERFLICFAVVAVLTALTGSWIVGVIGWAAFQAFLPARRT
jgi:hypothetical protein